MLRSLARNCQVAQIYVLCMDYNTKLVIEKLDLPNITCISMSEFETDTLLKKKSERTVAEYCWTLSSCFTSYVMDNFPDIQLLTYLDADLLFYSDVQPIFEEIGNASIAIIEHRFSDRLKHLEINGRFCVEWVSFRRDKEGLDCLSRWRNQCIEWCYYRLEDGKMGDQKYLDEWPNLYRSCHIIMHPGAGIAPWNYSKHFFSKDQDERITIDESLLIFYHFHQFQILENGSFDRLSKFYTSECEEPTNVYEIYEGEIRKSLDDIRMILPAFKSGIKSAQQIRSQRIIQQYAPACVKSIARKILSLSKIIS